MPAEQGRDQASHHSETDVPQSRPGADRGPFEARLRPSQSLAESELLSTLQLAHELRSPLASIQSALEMVLQGYARNDPELHDEMLTLARDRAVMMLGQVNDFLRLGAVQHSEVERKVRPVQLLDVLMRLVPEKEVRARWLAVEFHVEVPDSLPMVNATPEDMEHLISNLINNAIKYNKPGGSVTVSLRQEGDRVVGSVEDTGIGIAAEDIPRIFEEFYRAETAKDMDAHGTGLGLSIVKRIVDLYGGQLDVESKVDKGSKFSFAFARARPSVEKERVPEPLPEMLTEAPRISERPSRAGVRTFRHLRDQVVSVGLCGQCGGCVSFCSAGTLNALEMDDSAGSGQALPRYADRKKCLACGICYMICPVTSELDAEMREMFGWRAPIGNYRAVRSARALDDEIRAVATDGGVVTALLLHMLERRLIDGAIVSQRGTAFSRRPIIATTRAEILSAAGSCFGGSAHLGKLSDQYTTHSSTLSAVKALESQTLQRVAMVGTPCQIRSIRKMQCLGVVPAHIILYTIGLFCMESFAFDAAGRRTLEEKVQARAGHPVRFEEIHKLNVKEGLIVWLSDDPTPGRRGAGGGLRRVPVPFDELDEVARPACLACVDFGNDYADLSAGGLGSPDGYTTILVRTPKGSRVYGEALRHGYIEELLYQDRTEARGKQADIVAQVVAFAQHKRERGIARRRELGILKSGGMEDATPAPDR
jgi:coenzyme F420 hydrogenase subunit beta